MDRAEWMAMVTGELDAARGEYELKMEGIELDKAIDARNEEQVRRAVFRSSRGVAAVCLPERLKSIWAAYQDERSFVHTIRALKKELSRHQPETLTHLLDYRREFADGLFALARQPWFGATDRWRLNGLLNEVGEWRPPDSENISPA